MGQFPLDIMHDFWEKIAPYDALSVLRVLISQGKFTLVQYNRALCDLKLGNYETSDRPPQVKATSEKLPGKAMAVCLHI